MSNVFLISKDYEQTAYSSDSVSFTFGPDVSGYLSDPYLTETSSANPYNAIAINETGLAVYVIRRLYDEGGAQYLEIFSSSNLSVAVASWTRSSILEDTRTAPEYASRFVDLRHIFYINGVFVIEFLDDDIFKTYTSSDGSTWVLKHSETFASTTPCGKPAYKDGVYVRAGRWDGLYTSTDLATYSLVVTGKYFGFVFSGTTQFYACSMYETEDYLYGSSDGITWGVVAGPVVYNGMSINGDYEASYGAISDDCFIIKINDFTTGQDCFVRYSLTTFEVDYVTYSGAIIGDLNYYIRDIIYANGKFIFPFGVGSGSITNRRLTTSSDGITFTDIGAGNLDRFYWSYPAQPEILPIDFDLLLPAPEKEWTSYINTTEIF